MPRCLNFNARLPDQLHLLSLVRDKFDLNIRYGMTSHRPFSCVGHDRHRQIELTRSQTSIGLAHECAMGSTSATSDFGN